jgi:hypothetical protein
MTRATWKNSVSWNAILRPIMCSLLVGAPLVISGCRKAAVERLDTGLGGTTVQTGLVAGEPAYLLRPANQTTEPWYRPMQIVLDKKAADQKELDEQLSAAHAPIAAEMKKLIAEVDQAVQNRRKPNDRWSVLLLSCGRAKKVSDILFNADVGLTKLYAKRPVIAFNEMPLDLCIAKLSRESGIHDSQPRGFNPRVFWSKTNVSAIEAYEGVLSAHGFEHKFTDVGYKVSLRLQDYETRREFIDAAVEAIMVKGKALNEARPAITVTPRETPAPEAPAVDKEKTDKPRGADFKESGAKK